MKLEGKVAIVTGAGQGIGREYSKALSREGAKVVVAEIKEETGQAVADEINGLGGDATFVHLDLASEASCLEVAAAAKERYGGVDVLVNNGAIYHSMRPDSFMNVDLDYFNHFMAVNMTGQMLMTRAVLPSMKERGGGSVIFQSSGAAYRAASSPYCLSKLTVVGLTRGFASELGKFGIRVNCIAPGVIDTEATRVTVGEPVMDMMVKQLPLGRRGTTDDLLGILIFFASDDSKFVSGQVMLVNGGDDHRL